MDKEISIINSMIKETEERLRDLHRFMVYHFEEEIALNSKLNYLNNLLNNKNIINM